MSARLKTYVVLAFACCTLGLAPFVPEPHLVGKIRWIAGGAHGMQPLDWWDALLHGAPGLVLLARLCSDFVTVQLFSATESHRRTRKRATSVRCNCKN